MILNVPLGKMVLYFPENEPENSLKTCFKRSQQSDKKQQCKNVIPDRCIWALGNTCFLNANPQ